MMIKIISNPYTREIKFHSYNETSQQWEDIRVENKDSRLREDESGRSFLPFRIKEIIDTIIAEYYITDGEKIHILFEGTKDEYEEVENVCKEAEIRDKVILSRTPEFLENARNIFDPIKKHFAKVQPIIEKIIKDDEKVRKDLNKVSDALKDIIPICVFGNYSAGKSTFINALIGGEVLPSGDVPVTAKIYKIERSRYSDNAKVRFRFNGEPFDIFFEGTQYRIMKGNSENELIQEIINAIKESDTSDMYAFVRIALRLINEYEKKNKDDIVISNEVDLEIPFTGNQILSSSRNNFVIFDTPGSNSESNAEHYKVLQEALEGFSNGIPVWVSTYDSLDSTDNARLCEEILNIKALDERFTMIILNKADGADLDEGGFSEKKEQEILEYNSVEKMYAGGIYFVSSIMGLGAKKNGILMDKHYRKTYKNNMDDYSEPDGEDYTTLYKYNIMPLQIKKNVEKYSSECTDLIYANSGLYCIEQEMENFASKHSAYNKCQMVYVFLKDVIEETNRRIASKIESKERNRKELHEKLDSAKAKLMKKLGEKAEGLESDFEKKSRTDVRTFVESNLSYRYEVEDLEKIMEELHRENVEERHFSVQEKDYENSKNKISLNAKNNVKEIFKGEGKFLDRLGKMKDDFVRDYGALKESKGEKNLAEKEIDKETSDKLLEIVVAEYKKNIESAQEILSNTIKEYWQNNAQTFRKTLIDDITGSDVLSDSQREELSKIIMNYRSISFNDNAANIFIKKKFLRGRFCGLRLSNDEKLNIRKLSHRYNNNISKAAIEMSAEMNNNGYTSFKNWKESLFDLINANITEYNPELRNMADDIKDQTEQITELKENKDTIRYTMSEIEDLMAVKTLG